MTKEGEDKIDKVDKIDKEVTKEKEDKIEKEVEVTKEKEEVIDKVYKPKTIADLKEGKPVTMEDLLKVINEHDPDLKFDVNKKVNGKYKYHFTGKTEDGK